MLFLRSALFNCLFYLNLIIRLCIVMPAMFARDKNRIMRQARAWSYTSIKLQELIVGTKIEIEGAQNLPDGGFIFAAQHQSFWDTFAFLNILESPVFIFKQELLRFPVFGQCLMALDMIPVDRSAKGTAMASVLVGARREIRDNGRQLFIFPEGTRRKPSAAIQYKSGVGRIYEDIRVPIVPVVLSSGLFWGRNTFMRYPGQFKARILPPIMPGLSVEDVMDKLVQDTENAYDDLLLETEARNPNFTFTPDMQDRLAHIKQNRKSSDETRSL